MKKKFFALMIIWAFALNAVGTTFAGPKINETAKQGNPLAALLPASDAVMTLNIQRLFGDALPQILSGNQPLLAEIVGKIDQVKTKTGFDLRQFEQVAVGVSNKKISAKEMEFAPVLLARGTFSANALIALGKAAVTAKNSNIKYREEKVGDRTIYVFTSPVMFKTVPLPNKPNVPAQKTRSMFEKAIDKMFDNLSREFAVTVFDSNTLAIGSLARVRETFGTTPRIGSDVLDLVNRRPNAVVNFGARFVNGMSEFINLGNDEIGKNVAAIRYLSGAFDAGEGNGTISLSAKTAQPEQAKSMQEQLEGLQMLGKSFLGSSKIANKEIYARMIENVKIARLGNEITLDLQVPQNDINVLITKNKAQLSSSLK